VRAARTGAGWRWARTSCASRCCLLETGECARTHQGWVCCARCVHHRAMLVRLHGGCH
jgi:hypothetical protein